MSNPKAKAIGNVKRRTVVNKREFIIGINMQIDSCLNPDPSGRKNELAKSLQQKATKPQ